MALSQLSISGTKHNIIFCPGQRLGSGTYGIVYRASMMKEDGDYCAVALKIFKGNDAGKRADKEAERHLELGAVEGVVHLLGGAIAQPHSVWEPQPPEPALHNISYLVYELCDGSMWGMKGVSFVNTTRFLLDIVGACIRIHTRGLLHLDLRTANILVKDERALLGDFGISRSFDGIGAVEPPRRDDIFRYWLAPEVKTNQQGAWTDAYAISFMVTRLLLSPGERDYDEASVNPLHHAPDPPTKGAAATDPPTKGEAATRSNWRNVLDWVILARSESLETRRTASLLHLWYALKEAESLEPVPPSNMVLLGVAPPKQTNKKKGAIIMDASASKRAKQMAVGATK